MRKVVMGLLVLLMIFITGCTCEDNENGIDIYKKGVISVNDKKTSSIAEDECVQLNTIQPKTVNECFSDTCRVAELFCKNNIPHRQYFKCDYGCEDGACRKSVKILNCTDSDDGIDYYKKGVVEEEYAPGSFSKYTDSCFGDCLYEYYCENRKVKGVVCPYDQACKCKGGACTQKIS